MFLLLLVVYSLPTMEDKALVPHTVFLFSSHSLFNIRQRPLGTHLISIVRNIPETNHRKRRYTMKNQGESQKEIVKGCHKICGNLRDWSKFINWGADGIVTAFIF